MASTINNTSFVTLPEGKSRSTAFTFIVTRTGDTTGASARWV